MDKQTILEAYAMAYQTDRYPPLSGKIMGLFTITGKKYLTFEELMDELQISKGALSKNLKLLIASKKINFTYDKKNTRKRLFYLDVEGSKQHLQMIVDNFRFQRQLTIHAKKIRGEGDKEVDQFINDSINFSNDILKELKRLIAKHFTK
jgi:DNA-binding transcriptional regulator GbsR (MarR family)